MMNSTNTSVKSENIENDFFPKTILIGTVIFGTLISVISLFAILTLYKCKKILAQVRMASFHLCVANLGFGLTFASNATYFLITGTLCGTISKLIPFCCILYFMFLTFAGMDRLLSLRHPMTYKFWTQKRNMRIVAVVIYFMAACFGIIPNYPSKGLFVCQGKYDEMYTFNGLLSYVIIMTLLIITDFVSFLCIASIVTNKSLPGPFAERNAYTKYWKITKNIAKLGITSLILVTPFLVSRARDLLHFHDNSLNTSIVTYISAQFLYLHQIASPIIILCSYHECRYMALKSLLSCCQGLKEKCEQRYKQHYASYIISVQRGGEDQQNWRVMTSHPVAGTAAGPYDVYSEHQRY